MNPNGRILTHFAKLQNNGCTQGLGFHPQLASIKASPQGGNGLSILPVDTFGYLMWGWNCFRVNRADAFDCIVKSSISSQPRRNELEERSYKSKREKFPHHITVEGVNKYRTERVCVEVSWYGGCCPSHEVLVRKCAEYFSMILRRQNIYYVLVFGVVLLQSRSLVDKFPLCLIAWTFPATSDTLSTVWSSFIALSG